ncbi:MAG: peptidoglycan-binding protein, partial [Bacteroidota bacterium]|nr:peptidoglycan-binding protein [Bacteroidota bacterium]
MNYILHFSLLFFLFSSCNNSPKLTKSFVIARDTTIQPQNAFTALTLDSTAVATFAQQFVVNDSLKNKLTGFYNTRNYQFAWFTEDGLSEAGQAFWSLLQKSDAADSSIKTRQFHIGMQQLLNEEDGQPSTDSIQKIELDLTLHFFKYVRVMLAGRIEPEDMQWHIPKRKVNAIALLDSFLTGTDKTFQPLNNSFYQLQSKMDLYRDAVKSGGWQAINLGTKTLKQGQSNEAVKAIKNRLKASGDFMQSDTSLLFTAALTEAVKNSERRFGLKQNGIVTKDLVVQLNVPAQQRLQQMLINLERLRWLPDPEPDRLVANIPEYRLHVFQNNKEVLGMNIVVGKAANRTVIFSDELQYVVFSPYW